MLHLIISVLATLSTSGVNPFVEKYADWYAVTNDGSQFWIEKSNVDRDAMYGGGFVVWMNGIHENDKDVPYRKSIWRLRFDCQGAYYITACTTYDATDRVLDEYNGLGSLTYIRPNTIYQQIEQKYCKA